MKFLDLDKIPYEPVSHDPSLKKKVLARGVLPNVGQISHIVIRKGSSVSEHVHNEYYEVFYCIRGHANFRVKGEDITLKSGHLLIVEPDEIHSIPVVTEDTELLYLHVSAGKK